MTDGAQFARQVGKRINLNLLAVFDAVFMMRNLTAAGRAMGLSQPAMSHALAKLRWTFKDPLFLRSSGGLQPTPYATEIAPALAQALGMIRDTLEKAKFDPLQSNRAFRIAMSDVGERLLLPKFCKRLKTIAPNISIETCQPLVSDLHDSMARGEIDLAYGPIPQLESGFHQRLLYRAHYVCVVRKGHPTIGGSLTLQQYRETPHVVAYSTTTHTGTIVERALTDKKVRAKIAVRVPHYYSIPAIVAASDLIATLQRNVAEPFLKVFKLRMLAPPISLPTFDIKVYWHERNHLDPANKWLRDLCAELSTKPD